MNETTKFDWKKHLVECMRSTEFCALATVDLNGAWSNPVYFAWDESFTIYFISQPHSRHMKNIARDGRVSISIYSTEQSTFGDVKGIQLEGIATIAQNTDAACAVYYGRKYPNTAIEELKRTDQYIADASWQYVQIIPKQLYYFDTGKFGEQRQQVSNAVFE